MEKDSEVYVKHILDAISRVEDYTKNVDYEKYSLNNMIQAAVIREIEIVGEATKMLSQKFKEENPKIPWKSMAGMRDKLIHGYFGVDIDAVWKTVEDDLPVLKKELKRLCKE